MAFLHFGISLMFRMSSDRKNFKNVLKENREYLNKEFPLWRKSKFLNITYAISHKSNLKVAVGDNVFLRLLGNMFFSIRYFLFCGDVSRKRCSCQI